MIFTGGNSAINAHSIMREQLQSHLNRHYSLSQIVHILHETYQPLSSIAKLPIIPQLGIPVSFSGFNFFFGNGFNFGFMLGFHEILVFRDLGNFLGLRFCNSGSIV